MTIRWHVLFSGRVQGVGFRYTTCLAARALGVNGQVRNLRDGRVELIAEETEQRLQELLEQIRETTHGHISNCDINRLPATGEFTSFNVADSAW